MTFEELQEKIYEEKTGSFAVWIPTPGGGRIRKRNKSRKKLEAAIRDYLRAQGALDTDRALTVREVFDAYTVDRLRSGYVSKATATRDESYYDRHYGGSVLERQIMADTTADMWVRFLQGELSGLTAKQWAGLRAVTRGLLHFAEDAKIIDFTAEDILPRVRIHKGQFARAAKPRTPESQVFTDEEMSKIKSYCREHPDQYNRGILLLFATGMRVGELVCLKAADIRPGTLQVRITRTETQFYEPGTRHKITAPKDRPKTEAGIRMVSVPESERKLLQDIHDQAVRQPWAFCRLERDRHVRINAQGIRKRLYRICATLGFERKSPHKIRKTYASILLDAAADDRFVTDQLGHTDVRTSESAYHKNRKSAARKAKILSEIPELNA